jgi:hypothetical protein
MSDTAPPAPGAASALLNPPPAAAPAAPAAAPQAPASTVAPGSIRFMSDAFHKDGQFNEGWSENFEKAGLGRLAKIGMKYKDEGEFWKGLDHMAQFVGKKAGHLPPNETSTPEEIAEYRKQIGAPEDPTGYKFKPENLPPGSEWNDALSQKAEALMHQHNIPEKFAPELAKLSGEFMQDMADKAKAKFDETMDGYASASEARFKKEWGPEYGERHTQNIEFAKAHFGEENYNSNAYLRAALCMPEVMALVDIARREVRGAGLPGAGGEITNSMSLQQQIDEYCASHPKWSTTPHENAHVETLIKMQMQREKR